MTNPGTIVSSPIKATKHAIKFKPSDEERLQRIIAMSAAEGQQLSATVVIRTGIAALERQMLGLPLLDTKDMLASFIAAARGL